MYAIAFPNIFNGATVNRYKDYQAIKSNLKLLIASDRGSLYGDPHFGTAIKEVIYNQAHPNVVTELLKDDIFEAIYSYMPEITITRDDIDIIVDGTTVSATINVKSDSNVVSDLLQIDLLTVE